MKKLETDNYMISCPKYDITVQAIDDTKTPNGYLFIKFEEENGKRIGALLGLIRHPEYRAIGIVKGLYIVATSICRGEHCDIVRTTVLRSRIGVMRTLRALGFKEVDVDSDNHRRFEINLHDEDPRNDDRDSL